MLKYIVTQRAKGRTYHYFRHGGTYRRVPDPQSPEFSGVYNKLLARVTCDPASAPADPGSFSELVEKYLASTDYGRLAPSTAKEYRRHLDALKEMFGPVQAKRLSRAAVLEYGDTLKATPRKRSYRMQVLRKLLSFGVDRRGLAVNVALRPGNMGSLTEHQPWTDEEIATFQAAVADDLMMARAFMLAACTGQRRGDLVKMTRADYDGQRIAVCQNKTKEKVWVPAHPSLRAELAGVTTFMLLETERGKAFKPRWFSANFLNAIRRANLNGLTLHGLRVTAGVWLAEAGCTDAEIQAILGHKTAAMVAKYRRGAQKKVLAFAAMGKLEKSRPKV